MVKKRFDLKKEWKLAVGSALRLSYCFVGKALVLRDEWNYSGSVQNGNCWKNCEIVGSGSSTETTTSRLTGDEDEFVSSDYNWL